MLAMDTSRVSISYSRVILPFELLARVCNVIVLCTYSSRSNNMHTLVLASNMHTSVLVVIIIIIVCAY